MLMMLAFRPGGHVECNRRLPIFGGSCHVPPDRRLGAARLMLTSAVSLIDVKPSNLLRRRFWYPSSCNSARMRLCYRRAPTSFVLDHPLV